VHEAGCWRSEAAEQGGQSRRKDNNTRHVIVGSIFGGSTRQGTPSHHDLGTEQGPKA
jgi:hypothetical protein